MRKGLGRIVAALGCVGALFAPFAVAQQAAEPSGARGIEEMVVTAQKREERLIDVPQSVQAFSGEFVEERNIQDLRDVMKFVPGASVSFSGGSGSQLYNLRGTGAQGRIGQLAIGFYIDDVPWIAGGPFGPPIQLFDLASLEVLRGPQGTLYGQGSMGGTFVITTQRPNLQEVELRGRTWASDMKEGGASWGFDATMSVPIIENELGLRVTGGYNHNTGLAESDDFPGTDIDGFRNWDVRTKLLWQPSDDFDATLTVWKIEEDRNFSPGIYGSVDPPMIFGTGGVNSRVSQKTTLSSFVFNWDIGPGVLTSATSYIKAEGLFDAAFAFDTFIPGIGNINAVLQLTVPAENKAVDTEIRYTSTADGPFKWIVGGEITEVKGKNFVLSDFIRGPQFLVDLPAAVGNNRGLSERWAVFGEMSYELFDGKLVPLVGLRYYNDDLESFSVDANTGGIFDFEKSYNAFSPRFNLSYKPTDDVTLYVNVAKGFRSGVFNTNTQVQNAAILGITLARALPESTLWSYEVGARMQFFDNTLRIEPALYWLRFDDYQFEGSSGNVNFALQIEEVEGQGADLLVVWLPPLEGLTINATASYSAIEPTKIGLDLVRTQASLGEDEQLPFVPEWSYVLEGMYETPLPSWGVDGFVSLSFSHRDEQVDFITGRESVDPQELSLRFGVRAEKWTATLSGENLLDEEGPAVIAGGLPNRYDRRRVRLQVDWTLR